MVSSTSGIDGSSSFCPSSFFLLLARHAMVMQNRTPPSLPYVPNLKLLSLLVLGDRSSPTARKRGCRQCDFLRGDGSSGYYAVTFRQLRNSSRAGENRAHRIRLGFLSPAKRIPSIDCAQKCSEMPSSHPPKGFRASGSKRAAIVGWRASTLALVTFKVAEHSGPSHPHYMRLGIWDQRIEWLELVSFWQR